MKAKSLLALLFIVPLAACNKSGAAPKEITKDQALERVANNNAQDVIENCGRIAHEEFKISFSNKYGMFKNFTDEQIVGELKGKEHFYVEDDYDWLILSTDIVNNYNDETTWFYASGKNGVAVKQKYTYEDTPYNINATDTEYRFDEIIEETTTFGDHGQLVKYKGTYNYVLRTEYYDGVPESGFTMYWSEDYKYDNVMPIIK